MQQCINSRLECHEVLSDDCIPLCVTCDTEETGKSEEYPKSNEQNLVT